ncbi:kinase-like domain-containing protein [Dactylonectria macrodidyma]|uniref:non-specific serine/threonine protein kinase n=1 Tax=Dactylonectria macrodidyma TaxID=307937 RepID=A0A9P9DTP7_9HYPO|nr:kinase-like domain-containing protein [Dactylonectria macrodidyma]
MEKDLPDLACQIPDLVRDWELECSEINDACTVHASYVSDPAKGIWRQRIEEKWERKKFLGRGTFGLVSLQECTSGPQVGNDRAVKQISISSGQSTTEMKHLSRELLAVIKFSHKQYQDFFVSCCGWYYDRGSIFIAMEYLRLGNLESHLQQPLSEAEARVISQQTLMGLEFMHRSNIAHRDIKPQNILVKQKHPNWWVKIADFGCSKQNQSTALHTQIGTPAYLAPELYPYLLPDYDGTYSVAVDIWAVGAIAFRIMTGRLPFAMPPGSDLKRYVSGGPFPADDALSKESAAWITHAMSPDHTRRATASEALTGSWISTPLVIPQASAAAIEPETAMRESASNEVEDPSLSLQAWTTLSNLANHLPDAGHTEESALSPPASTSEHQGQVDQPVNDAFESTIMSISTETTIPPKAEAQQNQKEFSRIQEIRTSDSVLSIIFSHNGKLLATILGEKAVEKFGGNIGIWRPNEQGNWVIKEYLPVVAYQVAFTLDGTQLITNSYGKLNRVQNASPSLITWQLALRHPAIRVRDHPEIRISRRPWLISTALSSDAQRFAVASSATLPSQNGTKFWQRNTRTGEFEMLLASVNLIPKSRTIFVSHNGHLFVEQGLSGVLRLYSGLTWAKLSSYILGGNPPPLEDFKIQTAVFSPDDHWFVVATKGGRTSGIAGSTKFFRIIGGQRWIMHRIISHGFSQVNSVAFSPDSQRVALGWDHGRIELLNIQDIDLPQANQWLETRTANVSALAFSPDGTQLVSGSDRSLTVWSLSQDTSNEL